MVGVLHDTTRLHITPCGILTNSERNREDSVWLGYFTTQLGYTYYTMEPLQTTRVVAGKMLLNFKKRIVCGWGTSRQS